MNPLGDDLARSAMAGASTGGRTFTALAVLGLGAAPDAPGQPDAALAKPAVKGVLGLLAVTELVMDKLPSTPTRLGLAGLPGRLVASAMCGAIIARRQPQQLPSSPLSDPVAGAADPTAPPAGALAEDSRVRAALCAATAAATAAAASWLGVTWRSACESKVHHDWVGAVVEDAAVVGLAAGSARGR